MAPGACPVSNPVRSSRGGRHTKIRWGGICFIFYLHKQHKKTAPPSDLCLHGRHVMTWRGLRGPPGATRTNWTNYRCMGSSTGAYLSICELARHSTTIYPWEFSGSLLFSTSLPNRCIPNQLQIPVHVSRILKFVWKVYGFSIKLDSGSESFSQDFQ